MSERFSSMKWYNKVAIIATTLTSIATILAYAGLSFPRIVWAEEFEAFQKEYYIDKLNVAKDDLREIRIEEYKLQQSSQAVPEFIIEEKMVLEDKVKTLEKKVDKLEQEEHAKE